MIANGKIGQNPAKFDNAIDNIFKVVCGMNVHKRNKFFMQHTNQHNSNQFEDIHLWCPLVLFHVTKLFLSKSNKISVYQMTELAIKKLEHFPNIIEFIWSIRMIYNDKIGQTPEEFDHVIDNIFKVVCGMNVHKGKYILLQHTNQHNSNLFEDIRLWCPLVV